MQLTAIRGKGVEGLGEKVKKGLSKRTNKKPHRERQYVNNQRGKGVRGARKE